MSTEHYKGIGISCDLALHANCVKHGCVCKCHESNRITAPLYTPSQFENNVMAMAYEMFASNTMNRKVSYSYDQIETALYTLVDKTFGDPLSAKKVELLQDLMTDTSYAEHWSSTDFQKALKEVLG